MSYKVLIYEIYEF